MNLAAARQLRLLPAMWVSFLASSIKMSEKTDGHVTQTPASKRHFPVRGNSSKSKPSIQLAARKFWTSGAGQIKKQNRARKTGLWFHCGSLYSMIQKHSNNAFKQCDTIILYSTGVHLRMENRADFTELRSTRPASIFDGSISCITCSHLNWLQLLTKLISSARKTHATSCHCGQMWFQVRSCQTNLVNFWNRIELSKNLGSEVVTGPIHMPL